MPARLRYDGFDHLLQALSVVGGTGGQYMSLGKADFKSAFKTLPRAERQQWMCWSLAYNPRLQRLQVVPILSQSFGSLGAVVAWYRTARLLQHIMQELFGIVVYAYVDDFWPAMAREGADTVSAKWVLDMFRSVCSELSGWELDPDKEATGTELTLLG